MNRHATMGKSTLRHPDALARLLNTSRDVSKKPAILAVDDNRANLIALDAVLDRDFEVIYAESGPQAMAILRERTDIVVILMDVQMPTMDGFEAAKRIKQLPGCEDIPIVFITAVYHEDPYAKRGYEAGGVDYFTKPFDPDLLRLKMSIYGSFRQRAAALRDREEALRQTEALLDAGRKLSAVLEGLPVGVLIADIDGRIIQINAEASRICHANERMQHDAYGEMLGWWSSGGHAIKDPAGPLARALRSGESSHGEPIQISCFDGSPKTIVASASPLLEAAGKIVGAVIVLKDLTESRWIEEELEGRVARLVSLGVELQQAVQA